MYDLSACRLRVVSNTARGKQFSVLLACRVSFESRAMLVFRVKKYFIIKKLQQWSNRQDTKFYIRFTNFDSFAVHVFTNGYHCNLVPRILSLLRSRERTLGTRLLSISTISIESNSIRAWWPRVPNSNLSVDFKDVR